MLIKLTKKEANIIKYLASLKVDSPQYADVNQELSAKPLILQTKKEAPKCELIGASGALMP